ncbi:MAG TPA: polyketide synthase dehydratase domain-containing protein, partial [Xanthobacteraceae bacterium]
MLDAPRPWARPLVDGREAPRRAGLSSFGAGGANAHVVIEEYRAAPPPLREPSRQPVIVPLSAKTETALLDAIGRLKIYLEDHADDQTLVDLADLAHTLQIGRDAMRVRLAFVASGRADLLHQLKTVLSGDRSGVASGVVDRKNAAAGAPIDPAGLAPDARDIAARWVNGATVDWARLYVGHHPRRIPLPTYPFARKHFWLPQGAPVVTGDRSAVVTTNAEELSSAPAGLAAMREIAPGRFRAKFSGGEFFLRDHRVRGTPVLPGVVYLELMREAARRAGLAATMLRQVVWLKPLFVTEPTAIEVSISDAGSPLSRIDITTTAADGTRTVHAQAHLRTTTPTDNPGDSAIPSLSRLEAAHPHHHAAAEIYRAFEAMGLAYGPAHRAVAWLKTGTDDLGHAQVLGRLRLPDTIAAIAPGIVLHPSIMDGAFQAAIGMAFDADGNNQEEAALPFALESIEILGPCTPDMWVQVRPAPDRQGARVRTLDLDVIDAAGALRV